MIRPELRAGAARWSEVLAGLAVTAFGLWALQAEGRFFQLVAALIAAAGLGLTVLAWRRLRFRRGTDGPGIVQVVEGQISYFGPETGGFVALDGLAALHLVDDAQRWRLIAEDGTRLDIPVTAQGADALFDAFAQLPGMRMARVLDALDRGGADQRLWHAAPGQERRLPRP